MNEHELRGGVRNIGGRVEKAVGDVVGSRDLQVDGVVDQVAGGAEHLYGRAQSKIGDAVDAAPQVIEKGRAALSDAADRTLDAARDGRDAVVQGVGEHPVIVAAAVAALGGYALGWLIHGRRG